MIRSSTMPLLSIAIPTYNRVDCLRVVVERLLQELARIPQRESIVELIVVDNASTDGTRDYLDAVKARAPGVTVVHNPENLGMDGNFVKCFQQASGKWFWLCSDDDLPMLGAVSKLLETLRECDCSMVYLPTVFQSGSLEGNEGRVDAAQGLQVESPVQFAARVNGLFTFISCIVVNREDYVREVPHPRFDDLRGTYFAHLEWEFELLSRGLRFGYFQGPMLVARADNSGGFDFAQVFTERVYRACSIKLAKRPDLLKLVIDGMQFRHFPKLFYLTRIGRNGGLSIDSREARRSYARTFGAGPFYFLVMYPVFVLPLSLARAALFLGRVWGKIWIEWSTRVAAR